MKPITPPQTRQDAAVYRLIEARGLSLRPDTKDPYVEPDFVRN